jgi:hypothetical protein
MDPIGLHPPLYQFKKILMKVIVSNLAPSANYPKFLEDIKILNVSVV